METKSYSQYNQDLTIYNEFFKNKNNGFFVEIGADDGIRFSNCYIYEQKGWNGIAFEPRESAYKKCIKNRKCKVYNFLLSNEEKIVDFLEISGFGLGLSGIIEKYDPKHLQRIKKDKKEDTKHVVIKKTTHLLGKILEENNVSHIDFLSIDTEGSELDILSSVDFNKVFIDVICIEDNYNNPKLLKFFIDNGYRHVMTIKCDKIFKKNTQ